MKRILGAILAGVLVAGCGSGGTDLLFDLDLVVATNTQDDFSIAGVTTSLSGTRTYSWSCTQGQANLSIGSTLTAGSIRLEAFDGTGALVHDNTYEAVLIGGVTAFTKSGGSSGTWMLRFTFNNALWTGALTVRGDTLNDPDSISIGGTGALDASWIFEPGWDTTPVSVSIGGVSGGSIRVRIWDGSGTPVLDQTVSGVSAFTAGPSGAAGVWMVQIDYTSAVGAGAVTLSQP
jgi:hypothetical protein